MRYVEEISLIDGSYNELPGWSKVLCRVAEREISPGDRVVDLGAGPNAVVAKYLIKQGVIANWLIIEPNFSTLELPNSIVIKGDLQDLEANSVDIILFNPPVLKDSYLSPHTKYYHIFSGGACGIDVLEKVVLESQRCLRKGGRLIILCPSFLRPTKLFRLEPAILGYAHESFYSFVARAPLKEGYLTTKLIGAIKEQCDALLNFWEDQGVKHSPNSFAIVALRVENI